MISVTVMSHCCSQLRTLPVNTHTHARTHFWWTVPSFARHSAHGLGGMRRDGVRSCLVWSGPLLLCSGLGECLAWDKAVFEEELQMLVYYRLSCRAADKASEKLLSPGRTTHRHTLTRKINVYRRHSPPSTVSCCGRRGCQSSTIFRLWLSFLTACYMWRITSYKHMIIFPKASRYFRSFIKDIVSLNKLWQTL